MKIAIPMAGDKLSLHFGHCEKFALLEANPDTKEIVNVDYVDAPPHQPGLLPRWIKDQGVNLVIAGGMGHKAISLFNQLGIEVIVGAPADKPENIILAYLNGTLQTGQNVCDH
ncbi:MAG: NifB/NifX family molybdenum-iron cluster-binding protein [Desulfonauticus sp.]|nr:NifB/NifX family molybdenum-iron cluster-binding protein [Desulfonauticus sp.]